MLKKHIRRYNRAYVHDNRNYEIWIGPYCMAYPWVNRRMSKSFTHSTSDEVDTGYDLIIPIVKPP